jgi:hypothetical protein
MHRLEVLHLKADDCDARKCNVCDARLDLHRLDQEPSPLRESASGARARASSSARSRRPHARRTRASPARSFAFPVATTGKLRLNCLARNLGAERNWFSEFVR